MRVAALAAIALFCAGCPDREPDGKERASAGDPPAGETLSTLARRGRELFFGRAGCTACHMIGDRGEKIRGPNLGVGGDFHQPVAVRAQSREPGRAAIEYIVESIVDPTAYTVKGYARGVMKPPDEPPIALTNDEVLALAVFLAGGESLGAKDLKAARAEIPEARRARKRRSQASWADELIGRVHWDQGDPERGRRLFERLGCGGCHGNPKNTQVHAPDLTGVKERLSRPEFARWIIAPPKTRMPSYDLYVKADDLDDLAAFVMK